jgi:hypothetical protein
MKLTEYREEFLKGKWSRIESLEHREHEKVILFVLELLHSVTLDATSIASRDALKSVCAISLE